LQQAKKHLTEGVSMMREMEMGLWLVRAEAELRELMNQVESLPHGAGSAPARK
jgi:hypothetical protein